MHFSLAIGTLKKIGTERYKILLTIVPPKPVRDGEEARELLLDAQLPLLKAEIPRLIVFQRAALQGLPVYDVNNPKAQTAWKDYLAVGEELING